MPTLPQHDRAIAALRVAARTDFVDAKLPELALRVTPAGVKTWTVRYRVKGDRAAVHRRRLLLGAYPTLGLADAREKARDELRRVQKEGADPAGEKRAPAAPGAFTFGDLVPVYVAFARGRKREWQNDRAKIRRWLLPHWEDRPLKSLTRADVHEVLDRAVAAGLTTGVNRLQAVISRLFTVALDRGLIDAHPAARLLKRIAERPRDRVLTDDELRALWAGLEARPGRAADAVRFRLLTGQRMTEEIMPATWAELDLDGGTWTIPRERTKNRKQPHVVPLSTSAVTMLARRCREVGAAEPRVFPGLNPSSPDYRTLSTLRTGYAWIDLRRTVATRLAELGFSETTIGRVLNHARHTVTARHYNQHAYDEEKRAALDAWDRELRRILERKPKPRADVVPIERGVR